MFRYVTLTENNTIDKESANQFEGSVQVWVADNDLSTYLNTPWLCWAEKNNDGSYLLHIPADAPRPSYEQQIANFTDTVNNLKANDTELKSQLDAETKKNQALLAQIKEMQAQNSLLSAQVAQLSADDQAKTNALNSASAQTSEHSQPVQSSVGQQANVAPASSVASSSSVEVKSEAPAQSAQPAQSEAPKSEAPAESATPNVANYTINK